MHKRKVCLAAVALGVSFIFILSISSSVPAQEATISAQDVAPITVDGGFPFSVEVRRDRLVEADRLRLEQVPEGYAMPWATKAWPSGMVVSVVREEKLSNVSWIEAEFLNELKHAATIRRMTLVRNTDFVNREDLTASEIQSYVAAHSTTNLILHISHHGIRPNALFIESLKAKSIQPTLALVEALLGTAGNDNDVDLLDAWLSNQSVIRGRRLIPSVDLGSLMPIIIQRSLDSAKRPLQIATYEYTPPVNPGCKSIVMIDADNKVLGAIVDISVMGIALPVHLQQDPKSPNWIVRDKDVDHSYKEVIGKCIDNTILSLFFDFTLDTELRSGHLRKLSGMAMEMNVGVQ